MQPNIDYGFTTTLAGTTLSRARERVEQALKAQGFGVLTEIDVRATLQKKLGEEFRPYVILGACNPHLAHKALSADLGVGLLLPCNVVLWSEDAGTVVSIVDPEKMLEVSPNPALAPIAREAGQRLRAAFELLQAGT